MPPAPPWVGGVTQQQSRGLNAPEVTEPNSALRAASGGYRLRTCSQSFPSSLKIIHATCNYNLLLKSYTIQIKTRGLGPALWHSRPHMGITSRRDRDWVLVRAPFWSGSLCNQIRAPAQVPAALLLLQLLLMHPGERAGRPKNWAPATRAGEDMHAAPGSWLWPCGKLSS